MVRFCAAFVLIMTTFAASAQLDVAVSIPREAIKKLLPERDKNANTPLIYTNTSSAEQKYLPTRGTMRHSADTTNTDTTSSAEPINSLLDSGRWFIIKVDTSGVYKLTYDELEKIGLENPQDTRIFSYGGANLPLYCNEPIPNDMCEIPTLKEMGSDNVFGSGDYLVFYAQGPIVLNYDNQKGLFVHKRHNYSNSIYLMLTSDMGAGKDMAATAVGDSILDATHATTFDSYAYYSRERYNLVASGLRWYDNRLVTNSIDSTKFSFPNIVADEPVKVLAQSAGRMMNGTAFAFFRYRYMGHDVATCDILRPYDDYRYADFCEKVFSFTPLSSTFNLAYGLTSSNISSEGYINKICVNAREQLTYTGKRQLHFRDSRTAYSTAVVFEIANNGTTPMVMDITNPTDPFLVGVSHSDTSSRFAVVPQGTIREFVAFDPNNLLSPITSGTDLGEIGNQNLHGSSTPDMVIITPTDFMAQADELADIHRTHDGFNVKVVTQQQIFNEFSSGTPDVAAIRNYARMLYKRNGGFRYLLLFGDGTYDNRNILGTNANHILTYQTEDAESISESCVSDDFFGLLDDDEGGLSGMLDIAVGRLPANTVAEAQGMVDKIRRHLTNRDPGGWANTIAIIADDEERGDFVYDAEKLCSVIEENQPEYNVNKIYLDAYEQFSGSSGATYPAVNESVKMQFANGAAVIIYIGHGGPRKLSHESIFMLQDADALTNAGRMPFVFTASCEVGRFDDHTFNSLGEILVRNPKGGAIAALVTTRVVYNAANNELGRNIFYQDVTNGMRIGDIVMNAKNETGSIVSSNKRKFILLGDPAIRLAPSRGNSVNITEINGRPIRYLPDTINAIDTVTIEGQVYDANDNLLTTNGILYATVFDKKTTITTRSNDKASPKIDFETQNSVLYQGRASITDGHYKFSFIVPKDINYSYGFGKVSLYAVLDSNEAMGYSDRILIGGTPDDGRVFDFDGPEIEIFMTDTNFTNGFIVGSNPIVMARLYDESGINTTGNGVGHDIVAMVDYDVHSAIVLNDCYEGLIDHYNAGEIRFNLYNLEDGEHTLSLIAWDIYNNPSEVEITFVVSNSNSAAIGDVYNFPNPVTEDTYFYVNHNQTDNIVDISITIYDMQGRMIDRIGEKRGVGDTSPIYWNRQRSGRKIDSGIYLFVTEISGSMGKCRKSGKMVIERQ